MPRPSLYDKGHIIEVARDVEFQAFDRLGPKTKEILREQGWSACEVLEHIIAEQQDPVRDDAAIARDVRKVARHGSK